MGSDALLFNFHDIVAFRLVSACPEGKSFYANEFQSHRVENLPGCLPVVTMYYRSRGYFFDTPAGYTVHCHKLAARWCYRLSISDTAVEIDAIGNRVSMPMIHHMLVHHCLRYLGSINNTLMLHAGAVVTGRHSLILTGSGGVGKTTSISLLLASGRKDWSLHSDDYVFLGPGRSSHAYLTNSHLYSDLLKVLPDIANRLTTWERLRLAVFGHVRNLSKDRLKWPLRISVHRLWPDARPEMQAAIHALIVLKKGDAPTPELTGIPNKAALLEDLIQMNFEEASFFLMLVKKCRAVDNFAQWVSVWQKRERALLLEILRQTPSYTLMLPRAVRNRNVSTAVPGIIENLMNGN